MAKKKDIVFGAITNYEWDQVKFWLNSLKLTGFDGQIAMLVYNGSKALVDRLVAEGVSVFAFGKDEQGNFTYHDPKKPFPIVVTRFYHMWKFLKDVQNLSDYRFIISTDVKDVIFQRNPSEFLDKLSPDHMILAGSEELTYDHESWGRDNMRNSFPMLTEHMMTKVIYNAGTFAVDARWIDFFLQVYLTSFGNPCFNPDQAAFNILLASEPFASKTHFAEAKDAWACQMGTVADPRKAGEFSPHWLSRPPMIDEHGYVVNCFGETYYLVHQYDRNLIWKPMIEQHYGDS
jgi:hypothetical protein